jgi:hypothetical protein
LARTTCSFIAAGTDHVAPIAIATAMVVPGHPSRWLAAEFIEQTLACSRSTISECRRYQRSRISSRVAGTLPPGVKDHLTSAR